MYLSGWLGEAVPGCCWLRGVGASCGLTDGTCCGRTSPLPSDKARLGTEVTCAGTEPARIKLMCWRFWNVCGMAQAVCTGSALWGYMLEGVFIPSELKVTETLQRGSLA